jgi:lytic murein transglycosylase
MAFLAARIVATAIVVLSWQGAFAAPCSNSVGFERWLADFKREARSQRVSTEALSALDGLTPDPAVLASDRRQGVFAQSFLEFSDRMANKGRLASGQARIKKYKELFDRIEREYGVPAAVITGFWGLETDFGADNGKLPVIRSVMTLAYDCRRPDKFRAELVDALRIVDRGDMRPEEMIGTWAGEIGQTQFVPSIYFKYAVDYDHDGRRDLIHSTPDVLASTANYLKSLGWRRGEPWLREVRVSQDLDWQQADITIQHPVSQWERWGVQSADGKPLPDGGLKASLVLPLGRHGPAFLAFDNFKVYLEWNQSFLYSTTAAYFATRLDGAPPVSRGSGVAVFSVEQTKELQRLLKARGFDVGEIDGKIGLATRQSVKAMQIKFGLPADSYPNAELLAKLQGR